VRRGWTWVSKGGRGGGGEQDGCNDKGIIVVVV